MGEDSHTQERGAKMRKLLGLLAVCLMASGIAAAQTGSVTGMVVDGQGAAIEGARVALQAEGQCVAQVFTGADGVYLFDDVAVGIYTVKASKMQVGCASIEDVEVLEGQVTQVPDLVLGCGGGSGGGGGGGGSCPHGGKEQHQEQNRFGGGH